MNSISTPHQKKKGAGGMGVGVDTDHFLKILIDTVPLAELS